MDWRPFSVPDRRGDPDHARFGWTAKRGLIMPLGFAVWIATACAVGLIWLVRGLALVATDRRRQVLTPKSHDGPPANAPRVSILVAAKDEEDNIETCVSTLLEMDYPNFEIIAIDDRSTDRTPAILRRLEADAGGRLRVLTVRTLRKGWFGKNNAMREGVAASTGDWLMFTDADCKQDSRKTLSMAMSEALTSQSDFLSVTPLLETRTVWERIIQPVCAVVLIVRFLPERVNNPKSSVAYANGALMLMSRDCYNAIGGHERVRTKVNEDIHMARLAKSMGLRLRVVENHRLYRVRMYRSPGETWRGWSRIFYGCLETVPRLALVVSLLLVLSIAPWASFVVAAIGWAGADGEHARHWQYAFSAWAAVVGFQQAVAWRFYRVLRVGHRWSFTYIIGAIATVGVLISAMLKAAGATSTTWRGTTYRGDRLVEEGAIGASQPVAEPNAMEEPAP